MICENLCDEYVIYVTLFVGEVTKYLRGIVGGIRSTPFEFQENEQIIVYSGDIDRGSGDFVFGLPRQARMCLIEATADVRLYFRS